MPEYTRFVENVRRMKTFLLRLRVGVEGLKLRDSDAKVSRADVLFVCHDNDRAYEFGGQSFAPLLDSIAYELRLKGVSVQTLATKWSLLVGPKAYGSPFSMHRKYAQAALRDRLSSVLRNPLVFLPQRRKVSHHHKRTLWLSLLEQIQPKVVVVIGAEPHLMTAAHRISIRTVEILHGYRYSSVLWGYEDRLDSELPAEIWTLDDLSFASFRSLEQKGVEIKRVVNPWHEFVGDMTTPSVFHDSHPLAAVARKLEELQVGRPLVVVALTWGYESGGLLEGSFSNGLFPDELGNAISVFQRFSWIVRPHAVQLYGEAHRSSLRTITDIIQEHSNVSSLELAMSPLPLLLKRASGFVTTCSGSLAEAIEFGVPSLILDNSSQLSFYRNQYRAEIESGLVTVWDGSTTHLTGWLGELQSAQRPTETRLSKDAQADRLDRLSPKDLIFSLLRLHI